jgi:hypothetical protein
MKSKLLQKKGYGLNTPREGSTSSANTLKTRRCPESRCDNKPGRLSPATGALARKDFPGFPKHDCRSAKS